MVRSTIVWLAAACCGLRVCATESNGLLRDQAVAGQIFYLRQSFHHNLSSSGEPVAFYRHDLDSDLTKASGQQSPGPALTLRSQAISNLRPHQISVNSRWQQFISNVFSRSKGSEVRGPNVTDKETVVNLAKMTSDAYYQDPSVPDWLNLTDGFNRSQSFGWNKAGLRGHVFANADNSTVVISFKGTTIGYFDKVRTPDRENDNVLFSCCCATQRKDPYLYGKVCDCRNGTFSCNSTCLTAECGRDDRYYAKAKDVVLNVSVTYPNAQLWMVGHSLGGAIASLMGMTYHTPAVTFESPPERLPAQRLGLTMQGDHYFPASHFGNTGDPIYQGACNGLTSSCAAVGYAFETQCFSGRRCIYDTGNDLGWRLSIYNHQINYLITELYQKYDTVPECVPDEDCVGDCYNWSFS